MLIIPCQAARTLQVKVDIHRSQDDDNDDRNGRVPDRVHGAMNEPLWEHAGTTTMALDQARARSERTRILNVAPLHVEGT